MVAHGAPRSRGSDDPELELLRGCASSADSQAKSRCHTPTSSQDGWDTEARSEGDTPQRQCWNYNRGTVVGFVVFVIVISTFAIPESAPPLTAMVSGLYKVGQGLHSHARHHTYKALAHLRGTPKQCLPRPEPVFGSASRFIRATIRGWNETLPLEPPHEGQPWLVDNPGRDLLTIMTPVFPDDHTLSFLKNQLLSANKFLDMSTITEWLFVVPEYQLQRLVSFLEVQVALLPCVPAAKIRVITDESCAPELRMRALEALAGNRAHGISGWMKQQVVKLSCSFAVSTPFYLITDSDMFFLRPVSSLDLIDQQECQRDSGVCDARKTIAFRALNEMQPPMKKGDAQQMWIVNSATTLNMSVPKGSFRVMGVTPQILSRAVTDPLAQYLDQHLADRQAGDTWRSYLIRRIADGLRSPTPELAAWTVCRSLLSRSTTESSEYDLYWVFARNMDLWKVHHRHGILQRASCNVWIPEQYKYWDPCAEEENADEEHPGYWAVVQSTAQVPAEKVWAKLQHCADTREP